MASLETNYRRAAGDIAGRFSGVVAIAGRLHFVRAISDWD